MKTVILFLFILNRTLFLIVEKLLQKIKQIQIAHHVAYRFICYIKFLCTYYLWNQIYHIMRFWTLDEETFSYDGIILNITLTINEYEIITKCSFEFKEHYEFWFYPVNSYRFIKILSTLLQYYQTEMSFSVLFYLMFLVLVHTFWSRCCM